MNGFSDKSTLLTKLDQRSYLVPSKMETEDEIEVETKEKSVKNNNGLGSRVLNTVHLMRSTKVTPGSDIFQRGRSSYLFNVENIIVSISKDLLRIILMLIEGR